MHVMPASNDLHHRTNIDSESRRHGGAIEAASGRAPEIRFYMSGDLRAATGLSRTHLDFYLREGIVQSTARTESGYLLFLSLIHISEPTRRTPISYAVFCLK